MLNKWAERSKPELCAGITLVTLLIGYINYVVEPNVAMSAFYLLPITVAAWWVGLSFSLTIAVSSVALWLIGNLEHGGGLFNTLGHTAWNSGVRLTEYIVVAIAVNKLRNAQRELEARAPRTEPPNWRSRSTISYRTASASSGASDRTFTTASANTWQERRSSARRCTTSLPKRIFRKRAPRTGWWNC